MKILILDAYFFPEQIAFTHIENDLLTELVQAGHEIEVICPTPTRGIDEETRKKYGKIKNEKLMGGSVSVYRYWAPQEKKNPIARALRYFWCNICEYAIARRKENVDVIFVNSTPPTQGWIAGKLKKKLKCKFVYNLQDLFPHSLVATGLSKSNSFVYKIGHAIAKAAYDSADAIIVISKTFKEVLIQKEVPEHKVHVIYNWIDTEDVRPVAQEENRLFTEFGIDKNKFTVVYAGNFGAAQGADIILEAAKLLSDVQFVIFGGGAEFEEAKSKATKLSNVIINGLLPQERVPEVYSLGDIALITCKKGVGVSGMPSKTWSIMACETPIVAAFDTDSELSQIIQEANAGVCIEPGEAELLAQTVLAMQKGIDDYNGGRSYVCQYASKAICASKYVDILEQVT